MFGREIIKKVSIEGLHCNGCAKRVENAFAQLKQVKKVDVSFEEKLAILKLKKELTNEVITEVINNLGFTVINIE